MSNLVTVAVPSRLHLGFLDLGAHSGRRYGSIGLPLGSPQTVVTLGRAAKTQVDGPQAERAAAHLQDMVSHLGIESGHRLTIEQAIPPHVGLGSGTQIAMAVASALRTLHGLPLDAPSDARRLGRGDRSGIGIAAFAEGGLIVDAGRRDEDSAPTVVARLPFPEDWRVILVHDDAHSGLHGSAEVEAFTTLPRFVEADTGAICRETLMGVLAGLADRDIAMFGRAVALIQELIGKHFAPAQGGVFTSSAVARTMTLLRDGGATGIGQSSWGPTGFAFAPSREAAEAIVRAARAVAPAGIRLEIVSGRNSGADIGIRRLGLVGT
jgi:beta-ribofuranosylaminobenzene 5'-phosphate synthase